MKLKSIIIALMATFMPLTVSAQLSFEPENFPENPQDWYFSNHVHFPLDSAENMSYTQLIDSANAVLKVFPDYTYALHCRSVANMNLENYDSGLTDAIKMLKLGDDGSFQLIEYAARKQPKTAIVRLEQANSTLPLENELDSAIKYNLLSALAEAYENNHQPAQAYNRLKKASGFVYSEGSYYWCPTYMAKLLMHTGNDKGAVELLTPYWDGAVESGAVVNNLALALRDSGQVEKALKLYHDAWEDCGDDQFLMHYANLSAVTGDYDTAFKSFDDIINRIETGDDPEYYYQTWNLAEAYLRKGIHLIDSGKRSEGETCIRKSLALIEYSDEPQGFEQIAYAWLGERDKAFEWLEKLYGSDNQIIQCAVYNVLGDTDKALECLTKAYSNYDASPNQIKYDVNIRSITTNPKYPEALKAFHPLKLEQKVSVLQDRTNPLPIMNDNQEPL